MTKKDKITVDEIIGIVHTDETTNSVEEVRKLRGRNERFMIDTAGTLIDMETRNTYDYVSDVVDLLNDLSEENEQLKIRFNEEREKSLKFCRNIDTLTIENEQLKHKLKSLNDNFNHLKRLFDEIEEPISDELLAEYSRIVVEGFE